MSINIFHFIWNRFQQRLRNGEDELTFVALGNPEDQIVDELQPDVSDQALAFRDLSLTVLTVLSIISECIIISCKAVLLRT